MLSKTRLFVASLASFAAIILALANPGANAAQNSGAKINVAPFLQNVSIDSNASKKFDVTYTNDSNETQKLDLSVADFGSLDQSGGVAFVGDQATKLLDRYKLSTWLTLSEDSFMMAPHQKNTVTATVVNSPAMAPGGHYAAIVATVATGESSDKNKVTLKQKLSSLVFAVKTGGEKYDLSLQNIDRNGGSLHVPTEAYLTIKATGNVHVVPRGIVYLRSSNGKVLAKGAINQESGYVLPGTSRVFTVPLTKLASPKPWQTSFSLQVDYRYDGLDAYASKKQNFHIYNVQAFATVLFGLVLFIIIAKKIKFNSRKKVTKTD